MSNKLILTPEVQTRSQQNSWNLDLVLPIDYIIPAQYLVGGLVQSGVVRGASAFAEVAYPFLRNAALTENQVPRQVYTNFCQLLSRDVYSEGDSQALYDYIMIRADRMSPEFLSMLDLWLEDELKHYEALRRTYHCVAGVSFEEMNLQFSQRVHEIKPIELLLTDEFTLLVALMFDEIGSVYSYRRDLQEYYRHFGTSIGKIGHHLVKDEGMHFNNAAQLLLNHHRHRLSEVQELLAQISALEKSLQQYHKTFFLDHAQEQYRFPPHFNSVLIRLILARLGLGVSPSSRELQELWQWVPTGYQLIPIFGVAELRYETYSMSNS